MLAFGIQLRGRDIIMSQPIPLLRLGRQRLLISCMVVHHALRLLLTNHQIYRVPPKDERQHQSARRRVRLQDYDDGRDKNVRVDKLTHASTLSSSHIRTVST
jgi:hypothetical protein